jgi:3-phenylpropionate/cinnamic acid dioxygenase small subunit
VTTRSNFVLGEFRRCKQNIFVGRTTHRLGPEADNFKILVKKVFFLNSDGLYRQSDVLGVRHKDLGLF